MSSSSRYGTMEEAVWAAFLQGRMYVAAATIGGASPTVAAGSFLNMTLTNPPGSGVKAVLTQRRFDNNIGYNAASVSYGGIASPAAIVSPSVTVQPASLGDAPRVTAACTFAAKMDTTRLNNAAGNAVPTSTGFLPVGNVLKLVQPRMILPGEAFGNFITGQASGLGSVQLNGTWYWIEIPI